MTRLLALVLCLGVALAFFVIVISEFIGAEQGLGYLINDGRNFFLVPQMLGAAVLLGLLGYAGNSAVRALERRVLSRSWLMRGAAWWFVVPAGASVIAVIGAIKLTHYPAFPAWPFLAAAMIFSLA